MPKTDPLDGRRVRLVCCTDPHTQLPPGLEGTVQFVDDLGTVHVKWDNGSTLGLCLDAGDLFTIIPTHDELLPDPDEWPDYDGGAK